jgi:hypothetical protein
MNNPEVSEPIFTPLKLADYPMRHGVSCGDCSSACCTEGTVLLLTSEEAWGLIEAGTDLASYPEDDQHKLSRRAKRAGAAFFLMETACGNLELPDNGGPGKCKAFGKPNRPVICGEIRPADDECNAFRARAAFRGIMAQEPGVA